MRRKYINTKGLQFTPVWFEDKSLTSPEYFQISEFPTKLTAGKNLFKLRGHPTNLQVGGALNIEILDFNGNPIYYEVVNYLESDKSRVIAIYIYTETPAGDCTIILTAEAKNVPEEWVGKTNIRWLRTVSVNPNVSNVSEIIFEQPPLLSVREQIGPHLDRSYSGSIQFPTYNTGTVKYFLYNSQPAIELFNGEFNSDMVNGNITINTPVNASPIPVYQTNTTSYATTIKKVLSPTLALLNTNYTSYSTSSLTEHTYTAFDASSYNLTYEATPTYTETQNSESYALIEIKKLQPATGDISRIKLFMNNKGTVGTWEQINDVLLDETEIFVTTTSSLYPDRSIGYFNSQSIINTYWEGHTYTGFSETTAPTLIYNTASLFNAMQIQNNVDISGRNEVTVVEIKPTYSGVFIENSDYKVILDALATRSNQSGDLVLSLYMSGSSFTYDTTDYFNRELNRVLGKRIGELRSNTNNRRYDDELFSFTADKTGTGTLLLVVESGDWQVADIRTTSDNEEGYTPNYTRIKTLVPTAHKSNNQISFKAEYYNVVGERSNQISYVYNKKWEGGNRYIDGDYSMITGSLYVADSLETGVAITGQKNTGFIRSLGYEGFDAGFPGFLLWSGSAMSGSLGTKGAVPYSGVGLELYASTDNYLRYSTTDSELDIRTDNIFIGNSASFISASNGNIQISGSNISLTTPNFFLGDSNTFISGSNGNIKISGSNIDLSTEKFFLGNQSNFISGSNGNIQISGSNVSVSTPTFLLGTKDSQYISGSNGTIEISSSNFKIDTNGDVSANNMRLNEVAYADGFVYTTVVVDDLNYTEYYENYTITGLYITGSASPVSKQFTKLVLDGSKGGESVTQVRLERQPDWPIGTIIPPGHQIKSADRGYNITIENTLLNKNGNFAIVWLANAVASGSDVYDFGIHSEQWDVMAPGFTARQLGYYDIRGLANLTDTTIYGENYFGRFNTYDSGVLRRSQLFALPYGSITQLVRSVYGPRLYSANAYWQIRSLDDYRFSRQYFGSLKIGNGGVIIGGQGLMGEQAADVHYTSPHGSAILQLDAGQGTATYAAGSASVFIPPRVTETQRDKIGNPVDGSILYNTDTNTLQVHTPGGWQDLN